jgi:hypothetical protein
MGENRLNPNRSMHVYKRINHRFCAVGNTSESDG